MARRLWENALHTPSELRKTKVHASHFADITARVLNIFGLARYGHCIVFFQWLRIARQNVGKQARNIAIKIGRERQSEKVLVLITNSISSQISTWLAALIMKDHSHQITCSAAAAAASGWAAEREKKWAGLPENLAKGAMRIILPGYRTRRLSASRQEDERCPLCLLSFVSDWRIVTRALV